MHSVIAWLASLGLAQYEKSFVENDIDWDVLRHLTKEDLAELGLSLGHRKRMLRALAEMRDTPQTIETGTTKHDGERRRITVMFCDLVGSTTIAARLDPEDMREVIRGYHRLCTSVMKTYDGLITRFMGDGILVCFGYPGAHEDDAERAVRAALEILTRIGGVKTNLDVKLEARIGIATGLVVIGQLIGTGSPPTHDMVGETPNLAARLEAMAEPGTIVIADSTRRLLGDVFNLRELGRHNLKGFAEPVEAWAVEGVSASESRFEAIHPGRLTCFVGREREIDLLFERKQSAWQGHGQIIAVSGEAGIGKSRLTVQLSECISGEPHTQLSLQCSPYHSNSAFYPFITLLERTAGIMPEDPPEQRLDKLESVLALGNSTQPDVVPLFAALLSISCGDRYPPLTLSAAQQRRRTIGAILDYLERLSEQQPVLCVVEDIHWADATSVEVIDLAVERVRQTRVLLIITFRPEFEPSWGGLSNTTMLSLGRFDKLHVQMMVQDLTSGRVMPAEVVNQIIAKTDGVPLFVEELTKTVLEAGILVEDANGFRLDAALPPLAIPTTLHDSLMARLDRLAPAKEIAQVGAAIGREFSYALLSAAAGLDERTLKPALERLEETELLFRSGEPPEAVYSFKHALVRDAAYESLLKSRRQVLHERIAQSLCDLFPSVAGSEPEVVAHHFTQSGLLRPAAEWRVKAAERAQQRGAYLDAKAHLTQALELAEQINDAPARQLLQLQVLVAYGNALMVSNGYLAPETITAFTKARELAAQVQERPEIYPVYYGLWAASFVGGHLAQMKTEAEAFLRDVKRTPGSVEEAMARRVCGATCWFEGDYIGAREHLLRAQTLVDALGDDNRAQRFGVDVGVTVRLFLALVLWPLGDIDKARLLAEDAMTRSEGDGAAHTLNYAHFHKFMFEMISGNVEAALPHANAFHSRIKDQGANQGAAWGSFANGWANWLGGDRELGEAAMRQGWALMEDEALSVYSPFLAAILAEVEAHANVQAGINRLDSTLKETQQTGQHWFDAELQRRRGEFLLRKTPPDRPGAQAAFARALQIARDQQAKVFELRARLSTAKSYSSRDHGQAMRELLAPSVADLSPHLFEVKEAKRLLALSP
jgi:class 3 adenylate cyclase/tetratricopeptide (TPR) repeat protein